MMMTLGLFVFMLKTMPYQQLQHQRSWRFPTNSRVGVRPSVQFMGPDNDTVTLTGVLLPELTGGRITLFALEQIAELGRAWPLIEGSGAIYGMFVIESLDKTSTEFFSNGACRRIEFTLTLRRTDESLGEMFGSLSDQLTAMKSAATGAAGRLTSAVGGLLS